MSNDVNGLTHDDLVDIARRWLLTPKPGIYGDNFRHVSGKVVLTELSSWQEIPDAIGWHSGRSTLIECKTSVSDFKADAKKSFRIRPEEGLGMFRFFLTPKGLLMGQELPDGWGLLETTGKTVRVIRDSRAFEFCMRGEMDLLLSVLQRVSIVPDKCVSLLTYTLETKNRATLTIDKDDDVIDFDAARRAD